MLKALRHGVLGSALLTVFMLTAGLARAESAAQEEEAFTYEPPIIRDLLERAVLAQRDAQNPEGSWQAAKLYCEAARYGSAEGQYRLGMLYAVGNGVPMNRDLAAAMFSTASMQGHYESQKMLETVELGLMELPPCVMSEVEPEKGPSESAVADTSEIDRYVANLPNNKRWVLRLVDTIAAWYKVDPKLVLSIISVESDFAQHAQSNKQAQGLMQLIPDTAERFNVKNAFDASQNIKGGVAYLRWLLAYFEGDVALAVAAYNAGEGTVNKFQGVPPYAETRQYVKKVQSRYPVKYHPFDNRITDPSPVFKSAAIKRRG